jgi:hypothetical protein
MTEEIWKNSTHETVNRIMTLLDSSENLLDNGGNVCTGLYTYAVEEHGKLLFLKKYSPVSDKVTILYRDEFRDHIEKFAEANNKFAKFPPHPNPLKKTKKPPASTSSRKTILPWQVTLTRCE